MTPSQRFGILFLFLCIGIGFGVGFGSVFYTIRKKKDKQVTLKESIMLIILPSIFAFVTIGILIIIKIEYKTPVQLLIISGILLAGFMTALSTKKAWIFFMIFGFMIIEIGFEHLIYRLKDYINCKAAAMKEIKKNHEKLIIGTAPPISNVFNSNAAVASAPPISNASNSNAAVASAPPISSNSDTSK